MAEEQRGLAVESESVEALVGRDVVEPAVATTWTQEEAHRRKAAPLRMYLGAAPGRRQDLRDALRGAPAAGTRDGRRRRLRRDLRSQADDRDARRARGRPDAAPRVPRPRVRGDGRRRADRTQAAGRVGRRAGAHEHPGSEARQALGGRDRHPRGGHRGDHDHQHPAPREPERRDRQRDGDPPAGDGPRLAVRPRRPGGARRHVAPRAPAHGSRTGTSTRTRARPSSPCSGSSRRRT